ncbi:hypothetical protein CCACVL1_06736, partial [Corchorus capsularis]
RAQIPIHLSHVLDAHFDQTQVAKFDNSYQRNNKTQKEYNLSSHQAINYFPIITSMIPLIM